MILPPARTLTVGTICSMSNTSASASTFPVTLTSAAAKQALSLLPDDADGLVLRLAVRPGGCSGFAYELFFDSEVSDSDMVEVFDGLRVVVDSESAPLVSGATLDFEEGLMGAGFRFDNPNVTRTCGCGQSFC